MPASGAATPASGACIAGEGIAEVGIAAAAIPPVFIVGVDVGVDLDGDKAIDPLAPEPAGPIAIAPAAGSGAIVVAAAGGGAAISPAAPCMFVAAPGTAPSSGQPLTAQAHAAHSSHFSSLIGMLRPAERSLPIQCPYEDRGLFDRGLRRKLQIRGEPRSKLVKCGSFRPADSRRPSRSSRWRAVHRTPTMRRPTRRRAQKRTRVVSRAVRAALQLAAARAVTRLAAALQLAAARPARARAVEALATRRRATRAARTASVVNSCKSLASERHAHRCRCAWHPRRPRAAIRRRSCAGELRPNALKAKCRACLELVTASACRSRVAGARKLRNARIGITTRVTCRRSIAGPTCSDARVLRVDRLRLRR